jgi:peptide/nickel transport system ATP-binding protein
MNEDVLLSIKDLSVAYRGGGRRVPALTRVSLDVRPGEIVALVGESGSGKSTLGLSLLGILPESSQIQGEISFGGRDLVRCPKSEWNALRGGELAMVFQEPAAAFNPVYTIGYQMAEVFRYKSGIRNRRLIRANSLALCREVGLADPERVLAAYPHELSGGMLQRAMIAIALISKPALLVADEPTSALDVTIESQILKLFLRLKEERGLSILFITHDLDVAGAVSDRIGVLYEGRLVETGTTDTILGKPEHPYTRALVDSFRTLGEV